MIGCYMTDKKNENDMDLKSTSTSSRYSYLSCSPEYYQYTNYNPKGIFTGDDDLIQILKRMFPDRSVNNISKVILNEQLRCGIAFIDKQFTDHILKQYLTMKRYSFPKGTTIRQFIASWRNLLPENKTVLIRTHGGYLIFDTDDRRFHDRHKIRFDDRIYSAYILDIKRAIPEETDVFSLQPYKPVVKESERPDYIFYNNNPYAHDTDDCIFRALALFLDKTWEDIAKINTEFYLDTGRYLYTHNIQDNEPAVCEYMRSIGYHDLMDDRGDRKDWWKAFVTPEEFKNEEPEHIKGKCLFINNGHATVLVNGVICDTWDYMNSPFNRCYIRE